MTRITYHIEYQLNGRWYELPHSADANFDTVAAVFSGVVSRYAGIAHRLVDSAGVVWFPPTVARIAEAA